MRPAILAVVLFAAGVAPGLSKYAGPQPSPPPFQHVVHQARRAPQHSAPEHPVNVALVLHQLLRL